MFSFRLSAFFNPAWQHSHIRPEVGSRYTFILKCIFLPKNVYCMYGLSYLQSSRYNYRNGWRWVPAVSKFPKIFKQSIILGITSCTCWQITWSADTSNDLSISWIHQVNYWIRLKHDCISFSWQIRWPPELYLGHAAVKNSRGNCASSWLLVCSPSYRNWHRLCSCDVEHCTSMSSDLLSSISWVLGGPSACCRGDQAGVI